MIFWIVLFRQLVFFLLYRFVVSLQIQEKSLIKKKIGVNKHLPWVFKVFQQDVFSLQVNASLKFLVFLYCHLNQQ